jgi:hypothetical protein
MILLAIVAPADARRLALVIGDEMDRHVELKPIEPCN